MKLYSTGFWYLQDHLSKIIIQRICFFLLLFSISIAIFSQGEPYIVRNNVTECVFVRKTPNINSASTACLTAGTQVTVIGTVPFWREIKFGNNKKGWIAKKFIEPATTGPVDTDPTIPDTAFLTIHFIDVGQGDAIWIQTFDDKNDNNGKFDGKSIIIDGGPDSTNIPNALLSYIEGPAHHNADIEALILTHPHIDHYNGAKAILRHFTVKNYYDPGFPSDNVTYHNMIKRANGQMGTTAVEHMHIGKANFGTINWGSELKVDVLYSWDENANHPLGSATNTKENNSSIVLRIQYGDHVFLFMGDAEGKDRTDDPATPKYVEKILLDGDPSRLKANVLKIAHHGSETSSTLPFIQAVNPDILIVQSGRKSFSGTFLPDKTTLKRYCDNNPNTRIYRTDQGDANLSEAAAVDRDNIIIRSNGKGQIEVKAFRNGVPFTVTSCNN